MIHEAKPASVYAAGKVSLSRRRIWWGLSLGVMGLLSIGLFIRPVVAAIFADYFQGGEMSSRQLEVTADAPLPLTSVSLSTTPPANLLKSLSLPAVAKTGSRASDTIDPSAWRKSLSAVPPARLRTAITVFSAEEPIAPFVVELAQALRSAGPVPQSSLSPKEVLLLPVSPGSAGNSYALIPLELPRDSGSAAAHGDLNLKLRDPQPIAADLTLVDINEAGLDPDAPNLSSIFKPDFVRAYTVHDWDWGCNCQGQLLNQDHLVLLGLRTTPGEPVFIPRKKQDIYRGTYYALVLYASEDSLTFSYTRAGNVATGYTVHYLGLHTDPHLVALFRQSQGNALPGLTLNMPVGVATDELIVAIRDNGTFLDVRSRLDWWE